VAKKVFEFKPNEAEFNFGTEPKDASLEDPFSSQVKPSRVGEHALVRKVTTNASFEKMFYK
jgi:hypothetical protein